MGFDACIARVEVHAQLRPVLGQIPQQFLELGRQTRLRIQVAQQPTQGHVTLRHDHPELGQQTADAVADGQRLGLVALAHPVPGQPHLLVDRP